MKLNLNYMTKKTNLDENTNKYLKDLKMKFQKEQDFLYDKKQFIPSQESAIKKLISQIFEDMSKVTTEKMDEFSKNHIAFEYLHHNIERFEKVDYVKDNKIKEIVKSNWPKSKVMHALIKIFKSKSNLVNFRKIKHKKS